MKEYGYLDYGTIASLLIPPLLPPKRHYYHLLQNRTAPSPSAPNSSDAKSPRARSKALSLAQPKESLE